MNQRGQALVEFILIIPVILFLLMGTIELGNIIYRKYRLENELDTITNFYKEQKLTELSTYATNHNIMVTYQKEPQFTTIQVTTDIEILTPILKNIIHSPYSLETEMVVYEPNES